MPRIRVTGIALVALLSVMSSCSPSSSSNGPGTTVYHIGDTGPAGGLIFYDQGSTIGGWRYLEAAPYDQNTGQQWGAYLVKTNAIGTAVGTGKANTSLIVAAVGTGYSYPALLCKNLTLNGYSDWFLPSADEVTALYTNLAYNGLGSFTTSSGPGGGTYWSSTQDNANLMNAYGAFFFVSTNPPSGTPTSLPVSQYNRVRAIREF